MRVMLAALLMFSSTNGLCQGAPFSRADSTQLLDALAAYASTRTINNGILWVSPADSAGVMPFARALREDIRVADDQAAPRCSSASPTARVGNRVSAHLLRHSGDSAELRLTLRCTGGAESVGAIPLGSILIYALGRTDNRWRVVSLRALVS